MRLACTACLIASALSHAFAVPVSKASQSASKHHATVSATSFSLPTASAKTLIDWKEVRDDSLIGAGVALPVAAGSVYTWRKIQERKKKAELAAKAKKQPTIQEGSDTAKLEPEWQKVLADIDMNPTEDDQHQMESTENEEVAPQIEGTPIQEEVPIKKESSASDADLPAVPFRRGSSESSSVHQSPKAQVDKPIAETQPTVESIIADTEAYTKDIKGISEAFEKAKSSGSSALRLPEGFDYLKEYRPLTATEKQVLSRVSPDALWATINPIKDRLAMDREYYARKNSMKELEQSWAQYRKDKLAKIEQKYSKLREDFNTRFTNSQQQKSFADTMATEEKIEKANFEMGADVRQSKHYLAEDTVVSDNAVKLYEDPEIRQLTIEWYQQSLDPEWLAEHPNWRDELSSEITKYIEHDLPTLTNAETAATFSKINQAVITKSYPALEMDSNILDLSTSTGSEIVEDLSNGAEELVGKFTKSEWEALNNIGSDMAEAGGEAVADGVSQLFGHGL